MKKMVLPFAIIGICFAMASCANSQKQIAKGTNDSPKQKDHCGCSKCSCNEKEEKDHCGCGPNCGR